MYLVLQALLVVCVYLIVECHDCQARPGRVRGHNLQSLRFDQKII